MSKFIATGLILLSAFHYCGAQSNVSDLPKKFDAYQLALPKTKLHLVFNQDKFSPRDTAWFKAYFLTEELTGVEGKQLIDLHLVDSNGKSRLHFMFTVNNGIGQNQFAIPDTLPEGIYLVTAHSSWMKNFDPAFIFQKEIAIVNKYVLEPVEKPLLIAVAEGGHLTRNIPNRISIRTHRPESRIQLIDATEQEIGRAITDKNGLASIRMTPLPNVNYFVRIAGESVPVPLAVNEDGCGLQLTEIGSAFAKLVVNSPPGSALRNERIIVIVSSKGKIYHTAEVIQTTNDSVAIQIPLSKLPEGLAHISLLAPTGDLLASRDFYNDSQNRIQSKLHLAKEIFGPREKVRIEVSLSDENGQSVEGEFSIKVRNTDILEEERQNSLSDELNIVSSVKKRYLIDRTDTNWQTSLDNFLISVTEDLPWKEIMSKEVEKPLFPFTNVIEKRGRAYIADTSEPVPDFTQILFYLQKSKTSYSTVAHENGKISLAFFDIFGQDEFFYLAQLRGKEIPDIHITWEEEVIELPRPRMTRNTEKPDRYASFISDKRLIDQSFGFYKSDGRTITTNTNADGDVEQEIAEADININLADYIIFPTMSEFVKEVIPSMYYRENRKENIIRVQLLEPMAATSHPLYIIDGIATRNTAFFLSLKPSDLLTIKIINDPKKLFRLGLLGKNGIVMVQTKGGDVREPFADPSRKMEGLNRPVNFKSVDHSEEEDLHRPDFRATVYWNPSIKTDAKGKATVEFFCSDDIGKIKIRIEGLTIGGKAFSGELPLEVRTDNKKK